MKIFKKVIKSKALYFAIALLIQLTILFVLINEMVLTIFSSQSIEKFVD